jgi:DNA ligase (NAD+)
MDIEGLVGNSCFVVYNGLVHNYADLYTLTVNQILPLERMAQKVSSKIC